MKGAVSVEKALQGSKIESRELLEETKEKNILCDLQTLVSKTEKSTLLTYFLEWSQPEFPESRFSSPDIESETRKVRNSSPIPSPILTRFEIRDRFRVRFRVISRETRNFESETPILPIKTVKIVPILSLKLEKL